MLPTFPSRYWFTIGLPDVFSLAAWSPLIQTGFHVSRLTQVVISFEPVLPVRGCHPLRPHFPVRSSSTLELHDNSYNPAGAVTSTVWALPLSLAATRGVTVVFLSSDYLDVSVRRVGNLIGLTGLQPVGFPHSDIRGSKAVRASPRLFAACRVLLRLREPRHPPCALRYLSRTAPVPPPSRLTGPEYPRSLT